MTLLALPDGTPESAELHIEDIASATVAFDERGRKLIFLVLKTGRLVFVRHTEANVAYLSGVGLAPSPVPSVLKIPFQP